MIYLSLLGKRLESPPPFGSPPAKKRALEYVENSGYLIESLPYDYENLDALLETPSEFSPFETTLDLGEPSLLETLLEGSSTLEPLFELDQEPSFPIESDNSNILEISFSAKRSKNESYLLSRVDNDEKHRAGKARLVKVSALNEYLGYVQYLRVYIRSSSVPTFSLHTKKIVFECVVPFKSGIAEFELKPLKAANHEHFLVFEFLDDNGKLILSRTITDLYSAGHKHETGKKQKLFYESNFSVLRCHLIDSIPSWNLILV